uniref:Uncharacterized protein n=1 Tax=Meloidogyne hapla TaxID=6305 RepID=A0A1I8B5G6_MELHA
MLIIQHWLEQLFYCNYEIANFNELINPELIKLLFEENKRIPLKFNILGNCPILSTNSSCESLLDFILNNLKIGEDLQIDFSRVWNIDDNIEILFNLLIQEGGRFKKVYFQSIRESTIYKMIIKHIETSKDLTNIVNFISFNDMRWPIKLNIRAENIERRLVCNTQPDTKQSSTSTLDVKPVPFTPIRITNPYTKQPVTFTPIRITHPVTKQPIILTPRRITHPATKQSSSITLESSSKTTEKIMPRNTDSSSVQELEKNKASLENKMSIDHSNDDKISLEMKRTEIQPFKPKNIEATDDKMIQTEEIPIIQSLNQQNSPKFNLKYGDNINPFDDDHRIKDAILPKQLNKKDFGYVGKKQIELPTKNLVNPKVSSKQEEEEYRDLAEYNSNFSYFSHRFDFLDKKMI